MRRVILETPYAAPDSAGIQQNLDYARACLRDCLERDEAPLASHLLYTQPGVLRDSVSEERRWGIEAGLVWREVTDAGVFYTDRGWSPGMLFAKDCYEADGIAIEERTLPGFGICRHCGCTRITACGWLDGTDRACDAPACRDKELPF